MSGLIAPVVTSDVACPVDGQNALPITITPGVADAGDRYYIEAVTLGYTLFKSDGTTALVATSTLSHAEGTAGVKVQSDGSDGLGTGKIPFSVSSYLVATTTAVRSTATDASETVVCAAPIVSFSPDAYPPVGGTCSITRFTEFSGTTLWVHVVTAPVNSTAFDANNQHVVDDTYVNALTGFPIIVHGDTVGQDEMVFAGAADAQGLNEGPTTLLTFDVIPATNPDAVYRDGRLAPTLDACITGTGNAHRAILMYDGDSRQFITPNTTSGATKNGIGTSETLDQPGGEWEGATLRLKGIGYNIWGGKVTNACQTTFASPDSAAIVGSSENFGGHVVTIDPTGSTQAGKSFPYANAGHAGALLYIPTGGPYPAAAVTSTANVTSIENRLHYDAVPPVSVWNNPRILGDLTANNIRCAFSYTTEVGASAYIGVTLAKYSFSMDLDSAGDTNKAHITHSGASAGGTFVDGSIVVPLNNDATSDGGGFWGSFRDEPRIVQLFDRWGNLWGDSLVSAGGGLSTGPIWFSGMQFTHASIDPTVLNSTAGPCGFAVTPRHCHGGWTLTQLNAERATFGAAAIAEYTRACTRSCDHKIVVISAVENDLANSHGSFIFGTNPGNSGADATGYASGTGPAENTAAGFVQNVASYCAMEDAADDIENARRAAIGRNPLVSTVIVFIPHPRADEPYASSYPAFYAALKAWTDSGAAHSKRVVIAYAPGMLTAQNMHDLALFNGVIVSGEYNDLSHLSVDGNILVPRLFIDALFAAQSTEDPSIDIGVTPGSGYGGRGHTRGGYPSRYFSIP